MNVGCPTCGADVEFRYDDSFVRVCGSCRSAVLRSDRGIETLGQLADLVPLESPLQLFAEGKYRDISFLLVGMAQIQHGAGGLWQEWYAKLDGGQWAWVSEAQGRYYLTFERVGVSLPTYEELRPGAPISINGRWFTVAELGQATYASAAGEIPYKLDPKATFWFADLSDGQGGFATIDYNDGTEEPQLYVGHQATLQELGIYGGEQAYNIGEPKRQQGHKLACPNCGGSLELQAPDQTLRVACPYCNHLVSVQTGNLSVIAKLATKAMPRIALGSKGTFLDGEMTVIGYMQRSALVDGTWYPFDEYLLYAPAVGFRWLVCSDGHWSYVQPVAPGAVELMPISYEGVKFELFQRADLRVDEVLGEFYWQVTAGERVVAEDYIAPPAMLSCETSKTEQSWSLSTYMKKSEVLAAFKQKEMPLPSGVGVGANQPYPLHGIGKVAGIVTALLCVVGIARCQTAKNETKHTEIFEIEPRLSSLDTPPPTPEGEIPANVKFSQPFHLDPSKNIEIDLRAPLSNSWAYAAVDLVNEATGSVVSFDANLEYYSGYDDGESWSEGSSHGDQVLGPMEDGTYVLRVEGQQGGMTTLPLSITVRQDVFRGRWWLIAAGVLFLPFGLIWWHAYRFKKKRWENSQLVRSNEYTSHSSYSDFTAWEGDDD